MVISTRASICRPKIFKARAKPPALGFNKCLYGDFVGRVFPGVNGYLPNNLIM